MAQHPTNGLNQYPRRLLTALALVPELRPKLLCQRPVLLSF